MPINDGPRVFGDSDLTLALSQDGQIRLYIGQRQVGLIERLKVEASADQARPVVEVTFPRALTAELDAKVEEYARTLRTHPWVRVLRA